MENKAYALAAGLFTLVLGASVIVAAMWFSGRTEAQDTYVLESRFPVTGLNLQAPVRFRGIDVGKVEAIEFGASDSRLILIRVAVRSDTPVTKGTYAQLGSQGITGLAYVMLDDDGSRPQPVTHPDEIRIPVRQSFLDDITGASKDLVSDVTQVVRRLGALPSDENQGQMVRTLASLESETRRIGELVAGLEPTIRNAPGLLDDARKAFVRAEMLMADLNRLVADLRQRAEAVERVAKGVENAGAAAQALSSTALAETLPMINSLLDELSRTSRNLDRLLAELDQNPSSLVFGKPAGHPGPGEPDFDSRRGNRP